MSAIKVGNVLELFISKSGNSRRLSRSIILLDALGIKDDKYYNKDIERSILISSTYSYKLVNDNHINIPYGYLGENILTDYNPYSLDIGTKLQIGTTILQISQNCTICNHLAVVDKSIPNILKNDRGIFAKVIKNGEVKLGDKIYKI